MGSKQRNNIGVIEGFEDTHLSERTARQALHGL